MRLLLNGYDYHQTLIVDSKYAYQRSRNQPHYESIGGIYIGMSKNQVLKLYGNPSSEKYKYAGTGIFLEDFYFDSNIWKYDKDGFEVKFIGDFVFSITMYPNSNRKFDKSGLSANDSKLTYERKYNSKIHNGDFGSQMDIGHGESIFFNKDNSKTLGKTYG